MYLASPYSSHDPHVMEQRFEKVCQVTVSLMSLGILVYSPIVSCHPLAVRFKLPTDWEFWAKTDREFIAASSKVIVAMMDGWQESRGVAAEIAIANELGIPVEYLEV